MAENDSCGNAFEPQLWVELTPEGRALLDREDAAERKAWKEFSACLPKMPDGVPEGFADLWDAQERFIRLIYHHGFFAGYLENA